MTTTLGAFCNACKQAIIGQDGVALSAKLSLDGDVGFLAQQLATKQQSVGPGDLRNYQLREQWPTIVAGFVQTLILQNRGERVAAVKEFKECVMKPVIEMLNAAKDDSTNWLVPVIMGLIASAKLLSEAADEELLRRGQSATQLAAYAIELQSVFRALQSKSSELKRTACVAVTCLMMKTYFKLNAINNCKQPLKAVEPYFSAAKMAHKVTLRYYTGRLAAYDEDFKTADEHLTFAFTNCHPSAEGNMRKVLRYLIPVKMLLGVLPTEELLERYELHEYRDIRTALQAGDVALLLKTLDTHQARFIQSGTYLLLEKLQMAAFRRLFKKCFLVHEQLNPAKAHQVPIALFAAALAEQGVDKDELELQCILANLIYRKYLKGYLAYKARVVVLAKTDPFPDLATVQLSDPFTL